MTGQIGTAPYMHPAAYFALAAALVGALLVPGVAPGLNVLLVTALASGAVLRTGAHDLGRFGQASGALGFLLMVNFVLRTADWVLGLDTLAALILGVVAVTRPETWRQVARAGFEALASLPAGLGFSIRPVSGAARSLAPGRAVLIGRGVLVAAGLLFVFGGLLISADAAFASLARDAALPRVDLKLLPARFFIAIVVAATTGALVLLAREPLATVGVWGPFASDAKVRRKLDPIEWLPGIVVLDVVFAAFVSVQIAVLFGDHHHVLATEGLTYAEYARQGFFQLLAVVGLTIGVIAAVVNLGDLSSRSIRTVARISLGVLCALTSVVLMSAHFRLALYEDAYGLTRLRLLVHATIVWLAVILVLIAIAGVLWRAGWIPRTVLLITGAGLLTFNLLNPDALIAERNIERYRTTGKIDPYYLGSLSDDAVPVLATLEQPLRSCVLGIRASHSTDPTSVWSLNLARERSLDILESVRASTAACLP